MQQKDKYHTLVVNLRQSTIARLKELSRKHNDCGFAPIIRIAIDEFLAKELSTPTDVATNVSRASDGPAL